VLMRAKRIKERKRRRRSNSSVGGCSRRELEFGSRTATLKAVRRTAQCNLGAMISGLGYQRKLYALDSGDVSP
jgi:hypothetical protein